MRNIFEEYFLSIAFYVWSEIHVVCTPSYPRLLRYRTSAPLASNWAVGHSVFPSSISWFIEEPLCLPTRFSQRKMMSCTCTTGQLSLQNHVCDNGLSNDCLFVSHAPQNFFFKMRCSDSRHIFPPLSSPFFSHPFIASKYQFFPKWNKKWITPIK